MMVRGWPAARCGDIRQRITEASTSHLKLIRTTVGHLETIHLEFFITTSVQSVQERKKIGCALVRLAFGPGPTAAPGDDGTRRGRSNAGALKFLHEVQTQEHIFMTVQ
jgi:hypothetical protein